MLIRFTYNQLSITQHGDRDAAVKIFQRKLDKGIRLSVHYSPEHLLRTVRIENSIIVSDIETMNFLTNIQ